MESTIPYPLGTTPTGVVIYENISHIPEFNKDYVLKDSGGSFVSNIFHKDYSNFIDVTTFIDNVNNNVNITDQNDPNYNNISIPRSVIDNIINDFNVNYADVNLSHLVNYNTTDQWGQPNNPIDPLTPFSSFGNSFSQGTLPFTSLEINGQQMSNNNNSNIIYAFAKIHYSINLNKVLVYPKKVGEYYDEIEMTFVDQYDGEYYVLSTDINDGIVIDQTLNAILSINSYTGEVNYLCTITDSTEISKMILDKTNTILYFLVQTGSHSVQINNLYLDSGITDYSATTQLYHSRTDGGDLGISANNILLDNNNDIYYFEHFTGNVQKVIDSTTVSTYARFIYRIDRYGYGYNNSIPAYGHISGGATFDSSNNLYVSIDTNTFIASVSPRYKIANTTNPANRIPYSSTSCIMKIPYYNSVGTIYCPGTDFSPEQSLYNNVNVGSNYDVLQGTDMVFDSLGYLYFISGYNSTVYRIDVTNPVFPTDNYFFQGSGLVIDNYDNLYTNGHKLATRVYTFTHVYISDYQGQNSATLSLNNTTNSTVIDPSVIVYNVFGSDTSLSVFTIDGTSVSDGGNVDKPYGTTSVTVIATPTDSNASISSITGDTGLSIGSNQILVIVTAQDGITTQTYTAYITVASDNGGGGGPQLSSDTSLSVFTIDGAPVSDGYTLHVPYGTTSVIVIAITRDSTAAIYSITGDTGLTTGSNQIVVTVLAQDGITTQPYSVTILVDQNNSNNDAMCFKEDSKILCLINDVEMYVPVQEIKRGSLVKTSMDGYIAVDSIGYSKIYNPGHSLRCKNRLYKLLPDKYPLLREPLIITGCHSILVDSLTQKQEENIKEDFGRIFITDDKYRLMACYDENTIPYEDEGVYNIWHFSLENTNYYYNYGVYANGLLVETSSKRMMREFSGMVLL
jgi:hypothetical protein